MIGAAMACAQQPSPTPPKTEKPPDAKDQPAKSKLEELLEKALHDNPDVRLAAAKLAEAEAELSRARLQVVQKVAAAYQAIEAQKAAVESATAALNEVRKNPAYVPPDILQGAEQKLIDAKAKLAQLEADLSYLLGQQPAGVDDKAFRAWLRTDVQPPAAADGADYAKYEYARRVYLDLYGRLPTKEELVAGAAPALQGATADRIRAALDKPFNLKVTDKSLGEVIDELSKAFQDDNQGLLIKQNVGTGGLVVSVHFDHMPFGAALEWVEDAMPDARVVVRDYGLVIAPKDQVPPGAPLLHDFWKGAKADDKADAKRQASEWAPNPPPVLVEGLVKEVGKDGLVRLTVGSDAGLAKGQTLEAYRPGAMVGGNPMYITRLRIVEISAAESVGKPMFQGNGYVQPGDRVTSQLTGMLPAKNVEGQVKEVDKDGRIHIVLTGKGNGLGKGDLLNVIRQESEAGRALLVGQIRVIDVGDGEVVAESFGAQKTSAQLGDKVRGIDK
jgi:hypothetical protein